VTTQIGSWSERQLKLKKAHTAQLRNAFTAKKKWNRAISDISADAAGGKQTEITATPSESEPALKRRGAGLNRTDSMDAELNEETWRHALPEKLEKEEQDFYMTLHAEELLAFAEAGDPAGVSLADFVQKVDSDEDIRRIREERLAQQQEEKRQRRRKEREESLQGNEMLADYFKMPEETSPRKRIARALKSVNPFKRFKSNKSTTQQQRPTPSTRPSKPNLPGMSGEERQSSSDGDQAPLSCDLRRDSELRGMLQHYHDMRQHTLHGAPLPEPSQHDPGPDSPMSGSRPALPHRGGGVSSAEEYDDSDEVFSDGDGMSSPSMGAMKQKPALRSPLVPVMHSTADGAAFNILHPPDAEDEPISPSPRSPSVQELGDAAFEFPPEDEEDDKPLPPPRRDEPDKRPPSPNVETKASVGKTTEGDPIPRKPPDKVRDSASDDSKEADKNDESNSSEVKHSQDTRSEKQPPGPSEKRSRRSASVSAKTKPPSVPPPEIDDASPAPPLSWDAIASGAVAGPGGGVPDTEGGGGSRPVWSTQSHSLPAS